MKILYYNWAPLFDPLKRGGGVRLYQEGLIKRALAEGHQVVYFSAGVRYNSLRPGLRVVDTVRAYGVHSVREFEIVNSPVLAPSHHQFGRQLSREDEERYSEFLIEFIDSHGPFDVLHLNNAEGIPLSLLNDRARLNVKRVVLSLHNYHLLCQQVNLWHAERAACNDYQQGRRCTHCVTPPSTFEVLAASTYHDIISKAVTEGSKAHQALFYFYMRAKGVARRLLRAKRQLLSTGARPELQLLSVPTLADGERFRTHRSTAVAMINSGVDVALPVSYRVAAIFEGAGVSPSKLHPRYIATNFAASFELHAARSRTIRRQDATGILLNIAFLGYARKDKGFFFLLDALAALPAEAKKMISVTLAARGAAQQSGMIDASLTGFARQRVLDGYDHSDLKDILSNVDLGIVPVMWEDCLPQVAYEFVGNEVPILVSNMGGAPELVGPAELVFRAGDVDDFCRRIIAILQRPSILVEFWDNEKIPVLDWQAHWKELMAVYHEAAEMRPINRMKAEI